jgi:ElaA protein
MNWQLKKFEELTTIELYNILHLRSEVFVVEQNCVYQDLDNIDQQSYHLYCTNKESEILAYCRIIPPTIVYVEPSIGRVISNPLFRKTGIGKLLLEKAITETTFLYPNTTIKIGAQLYLKKFYESFGFIQISEIYDEDGIDHIKMLLQLS